MIKIIFLDNKEIRVYFMNNTMQIQCEKIMTLHVNLAAPVVVGNISDGLLRIIPIVGGTFQGKDMQGEILPGGADWNTETRENYSRVFAKYTIKTDDGIVISVENEGRIDFNGQKPPFFTFPKLEVDSGSRLAWLNKEPLIGTLTPLPEADNAVEIAFYRVGL